MGNSSNLTAGDGLSLAADIIKLLAPVLKETDKEKLENLKRNSRMVQDVFRRMLNGEPIVEDYGDPFSYAFVAFRNKTSGSRRVELDSDIRFVIWTYNVRDGDNRLLLEVRLEAYNVRKKEFVKRWERKFEKLIPMLDSNRFVSITSMNHSCMLRRNIAQGKLIAKRAILVLHNHNEADGVYYNLEIKVSKGDSFLLCENLFIDYHELETIGFKKVIRQFV